jgi:hypothetical protein
MVKVKYIVIVIFVITMVILGRWAILTFFPNEEKRVKKQFQLLAEWVSKEPGESIFTLNQKTKDTGNLFDRPCKVIANPISYSGSFTPEEIAHYAIRSRSFFSILNLRFFDFNIELQERETAKVILTAKLTGTLNTGEGVDETRELECVLKKIEDEWLFHQLEVIEVLKK